MACLLVSAIGCIAITFSTTFVYFCLSSIVLGFAMAPPLALASVLLTDMFGLENLTTTMPILLIPRGLGTYIGCPLAGYFFDRYGTYQVVFYIASASFFLSSIFIMLVSLFILLKGK